MVKCLECTIFSLQRVSEEEAMSGKGHCKPRVHFIRHDAFEERECDKFFKATPEVIAKRLSIIKVR